MAVSFVASSASGVVWRWLVNSATGDGSAEVQHHLPRTSASASWRTDGGLIPPEGMAAMALAGDLAAVGLCDGAVHWPGFPRHPARTSRGGRGRRRDRLPASTSVLLLASAPVALSALIILGHMLDEDVRPHRSRSPGAQCITSRYAAVYVLAGRCSPATTPKPPRSPSFLLLVVALVIVPYLIYVNRVEQRS